TLALLLQLFLHLDLALLLAPAFPGGLNTLAPGLDGRFSFPAGVEDVAQVIVNLDVLAGLVLNRLEHYALGLLEFLLLEQDPAQAIEIGAVVAVLVGLHTGIGLAPLAVEIKGLADQL